MARMKYVRRNSPGLVFILLTLVVVAVVGARFFDFRPDSSLPKEEPLVPPEPENTVVEESVLETLSGPAQKVLVYHTHASENYSPGKTHSAKSQPGDIVAVGAYLASRLEEAGYKVIHDTTLHDQPSYSEAYIAAKGTIEKRLAKDEFAAIIDVHRDGLPPGKPAGYTTAKIGGKSVAKVLLVVGDVNNPRSKENLAFAEKLRKKMEEMYPGLGRGIKAQHMDYNGGLHPNSIVAYIGDYRYNNIEEAKAGAALFADVLAVVLDEISGRSNVAPTTTP